MNNIIANIKKPYIIGAVILLVVIGGFFVYEHEYGPEAKYQKGLHYYKEKTTKKHYLYLKKQQNITMHQQKRSLDICI